MEDSNKKIGLPPSLMRYLPDSELEILSWDGAPRELTIRITKDIGPEVGLIRFSGVTHVNLPPQLGIAGIEIGGLNDLPPNYLSLYRPDDKVLDECEKVFLIHGSWGEEYFVIAQKLEYEVQV